MNALLALVAEDPFLAFLLHTTGLVTLLVPALLLVTRLDRRGPTARRHAVVHLGLWALLLLPLLIVVARTAGFGVAMLDQPQPAPAQTLVEPPGQPLESGVPPPIVGTDAPAAATATAATTTVTPLPATPRELPLGALLVALWLLGAVLLAARAAWAAARLRRHVRTLPAAGPALTDLAATAARSLQLAATPPIHVAHHACPATIGGLRPLLLLPDDLLGTFGNTTATAILRHELAHLALGHHRQALLQAAISAMFWWHPLARLLTRELGRLQEDLADNAALRQQPPAATTLDYAQSLLRLAQRATSPLPSPALSILGGHPFTRRIERLIRGGTEDMIRPDTTSNALAATVAAVAMLSPFPFQLLPAPVQDPAAKAVDPQSGAHWLPLQRGHRLVWQVTSKDGDAESKHQEEAVVWGEVPLDDQQTCAQVLHASTHGTQPCSYWRADRTGIWRYDNTYIGELRGVSPHAPTRLVPGPIGSETRWEWEQVLPFQIMQRVDEPAQPIEYPKAQHVGEIVAMAETVTVPAGTFTALHVRDTSRGGAESVHDLWFAPGVGIVKRVVAAPGRHTTHELLRHEAAASPPLDHVAVLENALGILRNEPVTWVPLEDSAFHLRGRFAVVRPRAGSPSCWYVGDQALQLAPDDLAAWQHVWQDFRRGDPPFSIEVKAQKRALFDAQPTITLATLAARVETERRGLRFLSYTERTSTSSDARPELDAGATAKAADSAGAEHAVTVKVDFRGEQVTKVTTTCDVPPPAGQPVAPQSVGGNTRR